MDILGYEFKNISFLEEALTHPSLNVHSKKKDYERLEFLGDSVLSLGVTRLLIYAFPKDKEGSLAKKRASLICKDWLANKAKLIGLGPLLNLTKSEEESGGRENLSNLANSFEAVIGAVYIDSDSFLTCYELIERFWKDDVYNLTEAPIEPKSTLQEWLQSNKYDNAKYEIIAKEGPAHNPTFTVKLAIKNIATVKTKAQSKKQAEREAAKQIISILKEKNLL